MTCRQHLSSAPVPDSATDRRTRRVLCGVCVCLSESVCVSAGCKRDEHIVCCTFSAYSFFFLFFFVLAASFRPHFDWRPARGTTVIGEGGGVLEAAKRVAVAALTCYVEIFCIFTLKSRSQRKICKVKRTKKISNNFNLLDWSGLIWPSSHFVCHFRLEHCQFVRRHFKGAPLPSSHYPWGYPVKICFWFVPVQGYLAYAQGFGYASLTRRCQPLCLAVWLSTSVCLPLVVCVWAVGVAEGVSQSQSATRQLPVRVISRWYL